LTQGNLTKNAQTTPALKTASYRGAVYLTTLVKKHKPHIRILLVEFYQNIT